MTRDKTIYDLIEKEREERRKDIAALHNKIDQIFTAINSIGKGEGQASWVRQSIGLTLAVISIVGFMIPTMISIVKPMQQQINYIEKHTSAHEETPGHMSAISDIYAIKEGLRSLNQKTQIQLAHHDHLIALTNKEHEGFLGVEVVKQQIQDMQRQVDSMIKLVEAKASDRFTGAEGKMMQKQIDRLEERLTFLTKQAMISGSVGQ